LFDEMPGAHKVFREILDTHMMFTDEEGADIMDDMIGGGHAGTEDADVDAGEDEIEETIEVMDADTGKSLG
jgi:hypothetical protein